MPIRSRNGGFFRGAATDSGQLPQPAQRAWQCIWVALGISRPGSFVVSLQLTHPSCCDFYTPDSCHKKSTAPSLIRTIGTRFSVRDLFETHRLRCVFRFIALVETNLVVSFSVESHSASSPGIPAASGMIGIGYAPNDYYR